MVTLVYSPWWISYPKGTVPTTGIRRPVRSNDFHERVLVLVDSRKALLALCAFFGLSLAMGGAFLPVEGEGESGGPSSLADGSVSSQGLARVGDRTLGIDDLRRVVEAQSQLRRGSPDIAELKGLLESLVDEELLIQRAEVLGLIDTDPELRRACQAAMKERVVRTVPTPTDDELRRLYDSRPEVYGGRPFELARSKVLRDQQRQARAQALEAALEDLRRRVPMTRFDGESKP